MMGTRLLGKDFPLPILPGVLRALSGVVVAVAGPAVPMPVVRRSAAIARLLIADRIAGSGPSEACDNWRPLSYKLRVEK